MHPIYEAIEAWLHKVAPKLVSGHSATFFLALRFGYRFLCTAAVTGLGYGVPHFSLISGLTGALCFWPVQASATLYNSISYQSAQSECRKQLPVANLYRIALHRFSTPSQCSWEFISPRAGWRKPCSPRLVSFCWLLSLRLLGVYMPWQQSSENNEILIDPYHI